MDTNTRCPRCLSFCELVPEQDHYPAGYGQAGEFVWKCKTCPRWARCVPGTNNIIGRPGTNADHAARKRADGAWCAIWSKHGGGGLKSRTEAVRWLAEKLKIGEVDCVIDCMDEKLADRVTDACSQLGLKI